MLLFKWVVRQKPARDNLSGVFIMEINKRDLAVKASLLYYEKNQSQNEIAEELGISRSYVSQLLSYARDTGIVRISINLDGRNLQMARREMEFKNRFPQLKQVLIMHSEEEDFSRNNLGRFAAPHLGEMIQEARVIGINLGNSVEKAVENLGPALGANSSEKTVIQIMGGLDHNEMSSSHPAEVVKKLSSILNCRYYYLNCPAVVEQPELRAALLKEKSIEQVISMWEDIDLAIMGVGVTGPGSKLFRLFNDKMKREMEESNACTELNINFFDLSGRSIPLIEDHKISISCEQMKRIRQKVVLCSGMGKSRAILGLIRSGMVDVLITDSLTVEAVEKIADIQQ